MTQATHSASTIPPSWNSLYLEGSQIESLGAPFAGTLPTRTIGAGFVTLSTEQMAHPEVLRRLAATRVVYQAARTGRGANEAALTISESPEDEVASWDGRLRAAALLATLRAGSGAFEPTFARLGRPQDAEAWTPWLEALFAADSGMVASERIVEVEAVLRARVDDPLWWQVADFRRQWFRFQLLYAVSEQHDHPDRARTRFEDLAKAADAPPKLRAEAQARLATLNQLAADTGSSVSALDIRFTSFALDDTDRQLALAVIRCFEPDCPRPTFRDLSRLSTEARLTYTGWSGLEAVAGGRRDPELTSFVAHLHDFRLVLERLLNRALVEPFRQVYRPTPGEPSSALVKAMRHGLTMGIGGLTRLLGSTRLERLSPTEQAFIQYLEGDRRLRIARSTDFVSKLRTLVAMNFHGINHDEDRARQDWQPLFAAIKKELYGDLHVDGDGLVQQLRDLVPNP